MEILYLKESRRIPIDLNDIRWLLTQSINYRIVLIDFDVVATAASVDDVPELHDRLIVGFPHSGEISIGDSSAKPGQFVSIPIALRGNGIWAVEVVLNYDDELLEFQGLDRKLAKTEFSYSISHSNGRLQIAVAGDADLSVGELMFVNFHLKDSVSLINEIPLTFTKAEVNEGNFAVRLKSGLISILPDKYRLLHNYPNPFNPDTWIPYQLPENADVLIKIYNIRGELVRTLALGMQPAGNYVQPKKAAYWDGMNDAGEQVASAVYFYTLQAGDFTTTRKMVILK